MSLDEAALRDFLEAKHDAWNRPDFIPDDPISIPHSYSRKEDMEISGLLAAVLAWGRRDLIVRAGRQLCGRMGASPHDFVMEADDVQLERLEGFVYRTFQTQDAAGFMHLLRAIYREHGGLEAVLAPRPGEPDTYAGIMRLRAVAVGLPAFAQRTRKHLADPSSGSSAKRLNMYLRWMVRRDKRGVDLGLWQDAHPRQLICPLDVHTGRTGRALGLLSRNQDDWRSATELTGGLRRFDPEDPVRFDFSLFGAGLEGFADEIG